MCLALIEAAVTHINGLSQDRSPPVGAVAPEHMNTVQVEEQQVQYIYIYMLIFFNTFYFCSSNIYMIMTDFRP